MNIIPRYLLFVCSCGLVLASGLAAAPAADKPNVVLIISDEIAYFEPGFMGGELLHTPNLDRLAASGVVMRQMLSGGANCATARSTLITGKHLGHASVRENTGDIPIRADETTIADVLKPLGYAVGGFGKWGIGGRGSTGVPEKHGFDVFFGYYDQVHAHTYYPPYLIRNSEEVWLPGNRGGLRGETYSHYVIHDEALAFIREHAGKRPFFAYLPYTLPHGPFTIPDDDPALDLYRDKPWPTDAILYAAMVTLLDTHVGEILDLLEQTGVRDNTLVLFGGDNGGADRFASDEHPRGLFSGNKDPQGPTEYRGGKGNPYEGAFRVPFAVSWPSRIEPGRVSEHLGYFPDLLPTIAEACGAKIPAEVNGISIVPELIGEQAAGRPQEQHEYLYWERGSWTAIRRGDWRAVWTRRGGEWELYDLAEDPAESNNLADEHPELVVELSALAREARVQARPGSYTSRDLTERDRRAKSGDVERVSGG